MNGKAIAWIALIIGILALTLSWVAYNRSGTDLENQIDAAVEEAMMEVREDFNRVENSIEEEVQEEVTEDEDETPQQ